MDYTVCLNEFERYLYDEERSYNTVTKYIRDVKLFLKFQQGDTQQGNKQEGNDMCKQQLCAFKEELIKIYAPKSVNSMLASVNKFLEFIGLESLKLKPIKIQKRIFADQNTELTEAEYQRLIRVALTRKNERLALILQTICVTGIRVSELEYITISSLHTGRTMVNCKGKQRTVLIPKELNKKLKLYCIEQQITEGIVFRTKSGRAIDRSNIWKMMKNLCRMANVSESKVFPHNLRHLFARSYYKIEKDISKLADILGHSDINTTRIYIMETSQKHAKQIDKLCLHLHPEMKTT